MSRRVVFFTEYSFGKLGVSEIAVNGFVISEVSIDDVVCESYAYKIRIACFLVNGNVYHEGSRYASACISCIIRNAEFFCYVFDNDRVFQRKGVNR